MPPAAHPPAAPGAWPLLGHLPQLIASPLDFFQRMHRYGPVVRIRLGTRPAYVVTRPELVRRLLVADYDLFDKGGPFFEKARLLIGNGLITCPAADHIRQRPLMQPAFNRSRLPHCSDIIRDAVTEVTGSWQPGQVIRLEEQMLRITALMTSRTLISAEQGLAAATQIATSLPNISRGLYWRTVIPGKLFPKLPLAVNRRFDRDMARVHSAIEQVVSHYRATGGDQGDLLSTLVTAYEQDKQEADPQQAIHDQAVTVLTAGVDTTAATLVWALRVLAQHPHIAERLLTELREELDGRLPGYDDIPRLPYTQRVLTETLRLYSPGWMISRVTTAEVDWNEARIPAGADVFFSPYALHRDPAVYPDPGTFDPDRWAPERVTTEQRQGFLPFGGGRRKCIGEALGTAEMLMTLATVLSRWRLHHLPGSAKPIMRMTLMPPLTRVRVERL